jgi:hypothetical protein
MQIGITIRNEVVRPKCVRTESEKGKLDLPWPNTAYVPRVVGNVATPQPITTFHR